jgi:hypothetical protein
MVSHVARAVLGDPEKADALVATLPSEALRAKARAMIVKRRGKTLARPESPQPASSNEVVAEPLPGVPAGDSSAQRAAETMMLDTLAQVLGVPLVSERVYLQLSNTDQQSSFRNRWSSSTSSRIASGSWSRCQRHSSRPAASLSPSGAAARAALIA